MTMFSERYGYVIPSSVLIREEITEEIKNAICSVYDLLSQSMCLAYYNGHKDMEMYLWRYFLNKRQNDFYDERGNHFLVVTPFIESNEHPWYRKLDLIEETLSYLSNKNDYFSEWNQYLVKNLNSEFQRLNFAYRIIDNHIVEVTSKEEIAAIETAIQNSSDGVRKHLHTAVELLSKRPEGDYRNSIKESISAVEVYCREQTGEQTLGKALAKLKAKGIVVPIMLEEAFKKLYHYTNDSTTGIRHGLMDDTNIPGTDEAIFMLISCSAFINYLTKKKAHV